MLSPTLAAPDDISDQELAHRVAANDAGALELMMRRYNQRLYRAARSILEDDREAEEAVQDAYLKAWRSMGTYRADARLSTWLTRIAINEALSRARKQRRRAGILPMDAGLSDATDFEEALPMQAATKDTPEHAAERADVHRLIERNIDHLPEAFRSVFVLRALEELSVEETASCLDIPEATVRSRYHRARGQLRTALAREIDLSMEGAFSFDGERCDRIVAAVLAKVQAGHSRAVPT